MTLLKRPKGIKEGYLFTYKDIAVLLSPLIVEQLLNVSVGVADSLMISSVGEAAVSAVSLVDSIIFLFITVLTAFATAGAVITGQYLGRKEHKSAIHAATQLILFNLIFGLVISACLEFFRQEIITVLFGGVAADVYDYSITYLRITNLSLPLYAVFLACAAIFRTMGNSKVPMVISMVMNVINVAGNAVCIYGLGMEVEGAAIPTLISRGFAGITLFVLLFNPNLLITLKGNINLKIDKKEMFNILRIGIPGGIENSSFQLGKVLLTGIVSTLGTTAIAANAVTGAFAVFNVIPGMSVGLGTITIISRCIGAGDYEQAKYYHRLLYKISYLCTFAIGVVVILISEFGLQLYNLSPQTRELSFWLIMVHTIGSMIMWTPSFHIPYTLRSAGDVRFCMVVATFSMFVFRVFAGYLLAIPFGLGLAGVWYAMMMDWLVRSIFFIARYKSEKWATKKVI